MNIVRLMDVMQLWEDKIVTRILTADSLGWDESNEDEWHRRVQQVHKQLLWARNREEL